MKEEQAEKGKGEDKKSEGGRRRGENGRKGIRKKKANRKNARSKAIGGGKKKIKDAQAKPLGPSGSPCCARIVSRFRIPDLEARFPKPRAASEGAGHAAAPKGAAQDRIPLRERSKRNKGESKRKASGRQASGIEGNERADRRKLGKNPFPTVQAYAENPCKRLTSHRFASISWRNRRRFHFPTRPLSSSQVHPAPPSARCERMRNPAK